MNLMENLAEVSFLKKEVKRRSMIFQCELKEDLAEKLGLPVWAFYHIPYKDLSVLTDDEKARKWFDKNKEIVEMEEKEDIERVHKEDV